MYTVEHDLIGFVEIHQDGRRIMLVNQWERSLEEDAAAARRIVDVLNRHDSVQAG